MCFDGKDEGNRPVEDRGVDGYKINFTETGCDGASRNAFVWPRIGTGCRTLVNTLINFLVPENMASFLTCWATISFSKVIPAHGVSLFVTIHDNNSYERNKARQIISVQTYKCSRMDGPRQFNGAESIWGDRVEKYFKALSPNILRHRRILLYLINVR